MNGLVPFKSYDKLDDFYFEIVNFPFLGEASPRLTSYAVYISQFIRFVIGFSNLLQEQKPFFDC